VEEDGKNPHQQRSGEDLRRGLLSYISVLAAATMTIHEPVEMTLTGTKKSISSRRRLWPTPLTTGAILSHGHVTLMWSPTLTQSAAQRPL